MTILLILMSSCGAGERPGKIKVLGLAKGHESTVLVSWFTAEPSTDPLIIATRGDQWAMGSDIQRYMRIYFPRNHQELLRYEFIIMAQVDLSFVTAEQQSWMYDAFTNHAKGGVNTRSVMSALSPFKELWRDSILSKAFPNDVDAVLAYEGEGAQGAIKIVDDPGLPNIMRSFKPYIEPIFPTHGGLVTVPRPGSRILSYMLDRSWPGPPAPGQVGHVFYWHWNKSVTFTFEDMVTWDFWKGRERWNPYALDIIANIVWFSTGRDLPPDPIRIHELRRDLFNFRIRRSILMSLLDFAEKFGANPSNLYAKLVGVDEMMGQGGALYLDWEFDPAAQRIKEAVAGLRQLETEASELKDRALFWIFLLEWLVTAGVSLLAGIVLWSIMVRRALYRDVATTRGAR